MSHFIDRQVGDLDPCASPVTHYYAALLCCLCLDSLCWLPECCYFLSVAARRLQKPFCIVSAAEDGIVFQLFSEDTSQTFFVSSLFRCPFLLFSSFWQEFRIGLGAGAEGGGTKANI